MDATLLVLLFTHFKEKLSVYSSRDFNTVMIIYVYFLQNVLLKKTVAEVACRMSNLMYSV